MNNSQHHPDYQALTCCGKKFSQKGGLTRHLDSKKDTFKCESCNTSFTRKDALYRHIEYHHSEKSSFNSGVVCEECGISFARKDSLTRHMKKHEEPFGVSCNECDVSFARPDGLQRHMKNVHEKPDKIACLCGKEFDRKDCLKRHLNEVHDEPEDAYKDHPDSKRKNIGKSSVQCCHCDTIVKKDSLLFHVKSVHGNRKFTCHHCDYRSVRKDTMERHELIHTEERPFKCEECSKSFKQWSELYYYHNNSIHKECASCHLKGCSGTFKYEYCYPCGLHKIGRTPKERRQDKVFQYIQQNYCNLKDELQPVFDSIPEGQSCTRKRPDILFTFPHRKIIVEVDEHQHKQYTCEQARLNEIASSGDIMPTIIIRFNPDKWKNEKGTVKNVDIQDRMSVLTEEIDKWIKDKEQAHFVHVIYLYYDGALRQEDFVPMSPEELDKQ